MESHFFSCISYSQFNEAIIFFTLIMLLTKFIIRFLGNNSLIAVWKNLIQESSAVRCVPPACQSYEFWPPDVSTGEWSLNERVWRGPRWCPLDVTSKGPGLGRIPSLRFRVQVWPCTVRSNASWVMVTWRPHVNRQTWVKILISINLVGGR